MDGQVIHVNGHPSLCDFSAKDHIHHHLEGGRRVSQPEEHDRWFEESFGGEECRLPFIPLFDADIVISPAYVELSEEGTPGEAVNSLGNEWRDIAVLLGPMVDRVVVLNRMELAIFLFDEEEVCSIGAPGFSDGAPFQVFGHKLVDFLYLELGERE